jgi:hypothetical protein
MTPVHRVAPLALAAAVTACASVTPSTTRIADCTGAAEAKLASLGIERADIESLFNSTDRANEAGVVTDRQVWAKPKSCQGHIVLRVDSACRILDMYTTGNCALPPGAKA